MEQANEIALERVAKETRCKMTCDTKRLRGLAEAEYKSREPNSDGMYSVGKSTLGTYMRFIAAATPSSDPRAD